MDKRKRKSRYSRLPIPEDTVKVLQNRNIPTLERVKLAEECRELYGYGKTDMQKITGISFEQYKGVSDLLQGNHPELLQRLENGEITVRKVLFELRNPGYIAEQERYPLLDQIRRLPCEIIYMDRRHILYRYEQHVVLGIAYKAHGKDEDIYITRQIICLLDDMPYAVDTTLKLLTDGYAVYCNDLSLHKTGQNNLGCLQHHIMAAYGNVSLNAVQEATVTFKVRNTDKDSRDLRISNLRCRAVTEHITPDYTGGKYHVSRCGNDIKIINQDTGAVTTTDNEKWLYKLLSDKKDYLKVQSRDNRLCIPICGSIEYLYHICMAVCLYGIPTNEEDLSVKLNRFRVECLSKGNQVDHLDNDCTNNHISNLIVMTKTQHYKKRSIEVGMINLGSSGAPYFMWLKRYDNTSVTMQAGYLRFMKEPTYMVCGVYSIDDFLAEADKFIQTAKEELHIFEELSVPTENIENQ